MSASTTNRYALVLEYDGSSFSGWQWQKDAPSVQTTLEQAIFALTQESVTLCAAGRTDSGVHATGQVAHVDLVQSWSLDSLRRGINFYLKDIPIKVLSVWETPPGFHARFSALSRHYQYVILNRPSSSALLEQRAWWIAAPLNQSAMAQGCTLLQGHRDFSHFRHRDCQSPTPWKTLDTLTLEPRGSCLIIHAKARSFLHRQVRIMVGALVALGREQWGLAHLEALLQPLEGREKTPGTFTTAPAKGLYLTQVDYSNARGEEAPGEEVIGGEAIGKGAAGGEVIGGEVIGGEAIGGGVIGGEVIGGEVIGGEVIGGEVIGGEVIGGEVIGVTEGHPWSLF